MHEEMPRVTKVLVQIELCVHGEVTRSMTQAELPRIQEFAISCYPALESHATSIVAVNLNELIAGQLAEMPASKFAVN